MLFRVRHMLRTQPLNGVTAFGPGPSWTDRGRCGARMPRNRDAVVYGQRP